MSHDKGLGSTDELLATLQRMKVEVEGEYSDQVGHGETEAGQGGEVEEQEDWGTHSTTG